VQVRHNTSLLEEAIAHVQRVAALPAAEAEAAIRDRSMRASAHRRLATGAAVAIAALGIGLGLHFGLMRNEAPAARPAAESSSQAAAKAPEPLNRPTPPTPQATPAPTTPAPSTPERSSLSPGSAATQTPPEPRTPVTTNFSKFAERDVSFLGTEWTISAGHHYSTELQQNWDSAWCYTTRLVEGVNVQVDLATRGSQYQSPTAPVATRQTLTQAGLSPASALALARHCPWLDDRVFGVDEYVSPTGFENPFTRAQQSFSPDGATLRFSGTIQADFLSTLQNHQFDTLYVDSIGGSVPAALAAGYWLRREGKTVVAEGECLSACVFVLAGGAVRDSLPAAQIGVHRFSSDGAISSQTALAVAQETASSILMYLERMGIDSELFHVMSQTPAESMQYLDRARLEAWRLISITPSDAPMEPASANVQDWFDGLPEDLRVQVQTDLLLLGYYDGFVDGRFGEGTRRALERYQQDQGAGAIPTQGELEQLGVSAATRFEEFGFELVSDDRGRSDLMVPLKLLPHSTETLRGHAYAAGDRSMVLETVAKPVAEQSFEDLFQALKGASSDRRITYQTLRADRFVLAGRDAEKSFYLLFYKTQTASVGFSFSWDTERSNVGPVLATYIASHFAPN